MSILYAFYKFLADNILTTDYFKRIVIFIPYSFARASVKLFKLMGKIYVSYGLHMAKVMYLYES